MSCPNCNLKMLTVFFKYENEKIIPDGIKRLLCEQCGYQEVLKTNEELIKDFGAGNWVNENKEMPCKICAKISTCEGCYIWEAVKDVIKEKMSI